MAKTEEKIIKIREDVLKTILAAAKDAHPHEFIALLGGKKDTIDELIFLPFESSQLAAIIHTDMLPLGMRIHGTVHSHPSKNIEPSAEDLQMFSRFGKIHIIVAHPFDEDSWRCYDKEGRKINLEVLDK